MFRFGALTRHIPSLGLGLSLVLALLTAAAGRRDPKVLSAHHQP